MFQFNLPCLSAHVSITVFSALSRFTCLHLPLGNTKDKHNVYLCLTALYIFIFTALSRSRVKNNSQYDQHCATSIELLFLFFRKYMFIEIYFTISATSTAVPSIFRICIYCMVSSHYICLDLFCFLTFCFLNIFNKTQSIDSGTRFHLVECMYVRRIVDISI